MARKEELTFNPFMKPEIMEGEQGNSDEVVVEGSEKDIFSDIRKDINSDILQDINLDNQLDISLSNQQTSKLSDEITGEISNQTSRKDARNKTSGKGKQKTGKVDDKKDNQKVVPLAQLDEESPQLGPESPMAALIASKKGRKNEKVFVGLHLPKDVDEVLTQFKKDTDIDRSEAVATAVRLLLKDYFDKR